MSEDQGRPDRCECCEKATEDLSQFSGWGHDPGEFDWLCDDCHDNAVTEE